MTAVALWPEPPDVVDLLGSNTSRVSPPVENRQNGRAIASDYRRRLRHWGSDLSYHKRVQKCGRVRCGPAVNVAVGEHGGAYFSGLVRCGSVWECPVCMEAIQLSRADEVRMCVERNRAAGGASDMATFTMAHDAGDELRPMRKHVTKSFSKMLTGAPWLRWKERLGLVGNIRALELTHGHHGWHVHIHAVVLYQAPISDELRREFRDWLSQRWAKYVTRPNATTGKVYRRPDPEHGVDLCPNRKADYIVKLGLAAELVLSSDKEGRKGNRSPLQLLASVERSNGLAKRDAALWVEYAREMHGARQLTWSRGLRDLYDVGEELTDEQLADAATNASTPVGDIAGDEWDRLLAGSVDAQLDLLEAIEAADPAAREEVLIRELDRIRGLAPVPF